MTAHLADTFQGVEARDDGTAAHDPHKDLPPPQGRCLPGIVQQRHNGLTVHLLRRTVMPPLDSNFLGNELFDELNGTETEGKDRQSHRQPDQHAGRRRHQRADYGNEAEQRGDGGERQRGRRADDP